MRINPFPTNRYCILILVGLFFLIGISTATNFTEYAYGTPTCSVVSGGLCSYLFDGLTSSAFLTNVNATIKMDYGAGVSRQINQITVWSQVSYANYAPREFIFEGSTDDITYTKLLEVSNNTAPAGRYSGTMGIAFNFTNTNAYRYYKLTPLYSDYAGRLGSSGSIGLSEIDLKNDDDSNTTLPYFYIPPTLNRSFTYTDWATYYASSVSVFANAPIQFTDASVNHTGTITNWYWVFGDGTSSTDQNPIKSYTSYGAKNVNLTIKVNNTNVTVTKKVYVVKIFDNPQYLFGYPNTAIGTAPGGGSLLQAFDRSSSTYWQAGDESYLGMDYGTPMTVNGIWTNAPGVSYPSYAPQAFSVEASNDNSNWTVIYDEYKNKTLKVTPRQTTNLMRYYNFSAPVTYRYYRVQNTLSRALTAEGLTSNSMTYAELDFAYSDTTLLYPNFKIEDSIMTMLDYNSYTESITLMKDHTYLLNSTTVNISYPITNYYWDVNYDNITESTDSSYSYTPTTLGSRTARLTVNDGVNGNQTKAITINVVTSLEPLYGESGATSASSTAGGNARYLFDGSNSEDYANAWRSSPPASDQWVKVDYGANRSIVINELEIRASTSYTQNTPRIFSLQGSNDDSNWVDLDNRTSTQYRAIPRYGNALSGYNYYMSSFNNNVSYRYYKLYINSTDTPQPGLTSEVIFSELRLRYHDPTLWLDADLYLNGDGYLGTDTYQIRNLNYQAFTVIRNKPVTFKDYTTGNPVSWIWEVTGDGVPDGFTQNYTTTYPTAGVYTGNLSVSDGVRTSNKLFVINVVDSFEYPYWYSEDGGIASASSTDQGNANYLFDGIPAAAYAQAWRTSQLGNQWIQLYYGNGEARIVNEIQIQSSSTYPTNVPRQFEINASNDGTTWTSLDKRLTTGNMLVRSSVGSEIYTYNITNTNAYKYYRITVTSASNNPLTSGLQPWYIISEIYLKYHDPVTFPIDPQFYIERDGVVNGEVSQKDDYGVNSSTYDTLSALTGSVIQFKDISLGSPDSWSWTFGDGTTNTTQNPVKTYSTAGEYLVNLTITKGSTVMTKTKRIYVMNSFEYAYYYRKGGSSFTEATASVTSGGNANYLFDGSPAAAYAQAWRSTTVGEQWIQLDYGATNTSKRVIINEVTLTPSSTYPQYMPFSFRISGSNDYTNWTILENRSDSIDRVGMRYSGSTPQTWGFINPTPYRYYRLYIVTSGMDEKIISEVSFKYHEPSTYIDADFTANRSYLTYDNILGYGIYRSVFKNEKVYFTDNSTGTGLTYKWDLNGDGITDSTNESTNWTYIAAGSYIVNHTAINSYGNSASKYMTIVVTDIVEPVYGLDVLHNVGNYFSVTGPSYYSNGYLYNILDHSAATRWWINTAPPKSIIYDYGGGVSYVNLMTGFRPPAINTYRIQSGTDATERSYMPTAWSVYGSNTNTGTGWTLLDTQTGQPGWGSSETRYYNFTNTVPYRYYNFTVTAAGATNVIIPELNYLIRNVTELVTAPDANFTFTPASANIYAQKVTFNDTSTNFPESWLWTFGDGHTSTLQNPIHWYSVNGTYPITLVSTNAGGSTQITKNYTQNSDWDSGVISWLHFNGSVDSTTITDQAGNSTWSAGGNAKISNTVMSGYGNGSLILDGASDISTTDPGFDMGSKNVTLEVWFKRGNTNSTGVQVIVSKSNLSSSGYILYIVNGKLSFSANSLSDQVILTENGTTTDTNWHFATVVRNINTWNLYKDGINVSRATWSGTVASNSFPLRLGKTDYTSPYTFNGNLDEFRYSDYVRWNETTYFSPAYFEYNSATEIPLEALVVLFSSNNTDGMSPLTVKFTDTSRGSPSSWNWSFRNVTGNDTQVWWTTTQNPVYTFGAGNWSIKLNATNAIESNMSDQTTFINVTPRTIPTASFTSNASYGLFPLGVQFNDTSDGMPDEWNWSFGDGTYDSIQNASKQYSTGGNFTVILNVTNSEGSNTKTAYITVWNRTNASFTANSTGGITPQTIQFTDGSSNATARNWSFQNVTGNNTEVWFSQLQSPTYTFGIGNFSIRLNVSNTWDTNLSTQTTFVNVSQIPPPTPDFTMNVSSGLFTLGVGFNDTSTGTPTSWNWSFGDGYLSTTKNTTHAYSTGGNYTVNLTTTNAGGSTSKIKYVTIYNRTTSAFSGTPVIGIVPFNVVFTGVAGNGTTYFWIFGDGNTTDNSLLSPEHYYTVAGNYSVNFSVSNGQSTNWTNKSNYITTAEIPVVSFTASNITGIATAIVNFTDTSSNAPTTWVWNATNVTGNNTPFTFSYAKHPTYTFRIGNFSITLNASNAVGNGISTQTTFINVSQVPAPVSDFSMNVSSGVFSLDVEFNDTSTGTPTSWNWSFGDGYLSTTKNTTHVFSTGGNYTINLTSTNAGGSSSQIKYVTVYNRTTSSFSGTPLSGNIPLNVVFTGVAGNGTTYFWIFGDGNTTDNSLLSPEHYYTSVGNYSVNFSVSNGQYTNWTNWSEYITASLGAIVPVASFTASNTTGTTTVIVNFTDTSSNTPTDWEWYATNVTGNSTQFTFSSEQNPVYTFRSGNFSIKLNASNPAGFNISEQTTFINVSVDIPPVSDFTMNTSSGLFPLGVEFNDTSTGGVITNWNWSFGDGYRSTNQNATHAYSTGGNYTVNLTVTNDGGSTSKIKYVTVYNRTTSAFSGTPTTINVPFNVVFTGVAGNGTTYLWIFGDGNTTDNSLLSPEHYYTVAGNYSVNFSVSNGEYTNWTNKSNYITANPEIFVPYASFTASNLTGITTAVVKFTDTSNNTPTGWVWNATNVTGNNTPFTFSTSQNPTYTFRIGNFSIKLKANTTSGYNVSEQTTFINVSPNTPPVSDFSMSTNSGLFPLVVVFTDTSTGVRSSWNWSFGDGNISTSQNPTHIYGSGGNYTINLTVTNDGGSSSKIKYATVYNTTTSAFTGTPLTGTVPFSVAFTGVAGNGTTYFWIFGDGNTTSNTQLSPEHYYRAAGNHSVNFSVSNGQYTNWTNKSLYIAAFSIGIVADFTSNTTLGSLPLAVQFNDTSTNNPTAWDWDFGDGTAHSYEQNPVHTYAVSGTYTVTMTASKLGSADVVTKLNYIQAITPGSDFTANITTGIFPLTIQFTDLSGGTPNAWNWYFGDGTVHVTEQNPLHTYTRSGTYTVILSVITGGVSYTQTKTNYITVTDATPVTQFRGDPLTGNEPLIVQFYDQSANAPTAWDWNFGDGTAHSTERNPIHTFENENMYTVTLTATNSYGSTPKTKINYIEVTAMEGLLMTDPVNVNTSSYCVEFNGRNIGAPTTVWFEYGMIQDYTNGFKSFKTPNQTGITGNYSYSQCGIPIIPGESYKVQSAGDVMGLYVYGMNRTFVVPDARAHPTTTYEVQVNKFVEDGLDPISLLTYDVWQPYLGLMGGLFFAILIAFIFMNIVIKQRTVSLTIIVLLLTGTAVWRLLPPAFVQVAQMLFIAGIAGILYWLFVKRR